MKKILISLILFILVLSMSGCGNSTAGSSSNTDSSNNSTGSAKIAARISFDVNDKSTVTFKEHVQDLWNKTKVLWLEDSKKDYSDAELIKLGKEIDEAWVNLQAHTSTASNGHDDTVQDTKDNILGNMTANIIGDTDKLYGERSQSETKEKRAERRTTALKNLESTIKKYDDKLAKLTIK
jgi:hypothetical protein